MDTESAELGGDRIGDLNPMEAAVFDKDLVRMHPGHNYSSEIHAFSFAFECLCYWMWMIDRSMLLHVLRPTGCLIN